MIPSSDDATYVSFDAASFADLRVGAYRLVRELGHGGMGTVFLAVRDDDEFHRRVAVKILKRGMDTASIVRRFRTERQILAGLDHPNIAKLLDGGTTDDGLPYLVMEYVAGTPLVEYADARQLQVRGRLEIFLQVCSAVQHAHQNLVIHRDLKPANVLVTAEGVPKLLDFGIAKLLNPEMAGQTLAPTLPGLQLMTPEYASPEQVRGETVTTATDVYSLGVLLYELLTRRQPYRFASRALPEIVRVVCEDEPLKPSAVVTRPLDPPAETSTPGTRPTDDPAPLRLRRRLEGDLDNIVLKALNKEPSRRYASADQFADDLRRHLAGLPVLARQDTFGYRMSKFVRRHRGAVTAATAVAAALVAGLVGVGWQARVAQAERERAEQRFDDVRALANAFLFDVHDAVKDLSGSTPARQLMVQKGIEYLDKIARDAGDRADLRRELAAGYVRVGDVQGRPFMANLGDSAGAALSYQKAVALYQSLNINATSPGDVRREAAMAHLRLSEIRRATGDTAAAIAGARAGLDLVRDTSADLTASPAERRDLALGYSRYADMLATTGDTAAALDYHRRSLALLQALDAAQPDDLATLRMLGAAHHKVGNLLGNPNSPNVGDREGALREMSQSVAVFERASRMDADNAVFVRNLGVARMGVADVLFALDRADEAMTEIGKAVAAHEAQVRGDPANATARNDLAIGLFKQAELLDATGRTRDALAPLERATSLQDQLAAADPGNARARADTATNHGLRGRFLAKLGQRGPAVASLDRAVDISRALARAHGDDVEVQVAVASALIERGDAWVRFLRGAGGADGDRVSAARDYAEAVDILTALKARSEIEGTDVEVLDATKKKLDDLRADR